MTELRDQMPDPKFSRGHPPGPNHRITTSRARSLYGDEPAKEVIVWLMAQWNELTPDQQSCATIECRPQKDFAMVGLRWPDNPET